VVYFVVETNNKDEISPLDFCGLIESKGKATREVSIDVFFLKKFKGRSAAGADWGMRVEKFQTFFR
jgi:hypothetical protein